VDASQPLCTWAGCRPSGCFIAALACASVMPLPVAAILASTVSRRVIAVPGSRIGLYFVGSSTMPASVAAWVMVSLAAVVLKYVSAAASTPQAPLP
jgi:type IV secretory pathway protease TraF